ncbi:hypothetical protein [Natrinema pallidum]|uniref:hypothetical protein n=1 Tax=Natrinema pallidum TaxID=69527 RepID=UPI00375183E1
MATEVTSLRHSTAGELPRRLTTLLLEATIDTDVDGNGSLTVDFQDDGGRSFEAQPFVTFDETSAPAAEVSAVDTDTLTIDISGSSTTEGTVTVRAVVRGRKD